MKGSRFLARKGWRHLAILGPYIVGTILLVAAASKVPHFKGWAPYLVSGDALMEWYLQVGAAIMESAIGLQLVFAKDKSPSCKAGLGLLALFTGYLFYLHFWTDAKSCGCGAGEDLVASTKHGIFLVSIIRNIGMAAMLLLNLELVTGCVSHAITRWRHSFKMGAA